MKKEAVAPPRAVMFAQGHRHAALYLMEPWYELVDVLDDMWMETEALLFGQPGSSTES